VPALPPPINQLNLLDTLQQQTATEEATNNTPPIYSVTSLTQLLGTAWKQHPQLGQKLLVEGEISNLKKSARGHMYFTLKDEGASISGVLWASTASKLKITLEEGMAVIATGMVEVYAPSGNYSLVVSKMEPVGLGALQLAYQQLKETLEAEGLFELDRKRPLPLFPLKIGLVTSSTGSVLHDMMRVIQAKNPTLTVVLASAKVQGVNAATEIATAINALQEPSLGLEALIVARGGGSFEDLFCFSEEAVVRAIANSTIPVVTGIGHEPDFGLADAVADYSAQTPTAAADYVVGDWYNWQETLQQTSHWLTEATQRTILSAEQQLDAQITLLEDGLQQQLNQTQQTITQLTDNLTRESQQALYWAENTLHQQATELEAFSPLKVLNRGYAVLEKTDDEAVHTVQHVQQVRVGDSLTARLATGKLLLRVEDCLP
jgi:exodeoxyribonuclease VII large subunit